MYGFKIQTSITYVDAAEGSNDVTGTPMDGDEWIFRINNLTSILIMKVIISALFLLSTLMLQAQFSPQSKEVTEKFFPELDIEINTPAFQKTKGYTNYEELMAFLNNLQENHSDKMSIEFIGESQKGKKVPLVKISDKSSSAKKINFWIQAGIHGNEPASTEGILFLMDRILNDSEYQGVLAKIDLGIIPMANIDGYEKQSRYAANGLDLNRDQTKLMIKESVFLKQAFTDFEADVAMDFHEYRPYRRDYLKMGDWGMTSAYDVMFLYSANLNVPEELRIATKDFFIKPVKARMDEIGLRSRDYISSTKHFGETQINQGSISSRSSATSYALSNCISTLVEVRGVALNRTSFKRRVNTTFEVAWSYLKTAALVGEEIKTIRKRTASNTDAEAVVTFNRNVYTGQVSFIDLATNELIDTTMVIRDAWGSTPDLTRIRPNAYILLPRYEDLVQKLKVLGVEVEVTESEKQLEVETYHVSEYFQEKLPYEGVRRQIVKTDVKAASKTIPKGSFIVKMDQEHANFAVEVLEPEAANSFISFDVLQTELGAELPIYRYLKKENL